MAKLTDYRLLVQVGAGRDGIAYRAEAAGGAAVEVRVLAGAVTDGERWHYLLRRLRLAKLLEHPAALRVRELELGHDPPFAVCDWCEGETLAGELEPLSSARLAALVQPVAEALAAAHGLGLVHGRLTPTELRRDGRGHVRVDFSDLQVSAATWKREPAFDPPEGRTTDPAGDVFRFGAVLAALIRQAGITYDDADASTVELSAERSTVRASPLADLASAAMAADPPARPTMRELSTRLAALTARGKPDTELTLSSADGKGGEAAKAFEEPEDPLLQRGRLGRFRLLHQIGQGGMGAVYRGEDLADGSAVAVKVLRANRVGNEAALRRFHKEARLLAEVNNAYVTNLLEINEDDGVHFLVLEYVEGQSLDKLLREETRLEVPQALGILADVARALVEAHERGIVHRDVKPENILIRKEADAYRVKLADFGLARHVVETESLNVTRAGAIIGTPLYMSPEQCSGSAVSPPSDIYSMGATLFHLLSGRPPFSAGSPLEIIAKHCQEPPPKLKTLHPDLSDGVCQVVEKCLAKMPEARYANAAALLRDLERLLRGEPTGIMVHPRLPAANPDHVLNYDWMFALEASPSQLWPHVTNTERLNRAAGLTAVQFTTEPGPAKGVRRHGEFRRAGISVRWEEHPFEWVEGRRFGVLREYSQGPFNWLVSIVELEPRPGGGTTLWHRVRLEPAGLLGRTLAAVEVGIKGKRAVERVYQRIDAAVTGKLGRSGLEDPFEEPASLTPAQRSRLDTHLEQLAAAGIDPAAVETFGDFLALAPAQEVSRVRPLALARRLGLAPDQVVAACLHGAREGLLVLLWDILCPVCRIPSEVKETLKALREHGRCEACNLDFELDFANSVEMVFRAHPQVRDCEVGIYCIGGPAHSPHVAAQVRIAPGECIELDLTLPEGAYKLRGPQLPFAVDFRVEPGAAHKRVDLNLSRGPGPGLPRTLHTRGQLFALTNDEAHELVVRIERTAPREDALTAARASTLALFRELFPGEILTPGQLVSVANITLVVTALDQAEELYRQRGDAQAFGLVHEHFRLLNDCIRREGGALVKTVGEGIVAAFTEPVAAVRAAAAFPEALAANPTTQSLSLRVAVHRGPALAATLNDLLDYFGTTVNLATRLPQLASRGELLLTAAVAADPQVAAFLAARNLTGAISTAVDPSGAEFVLHRFGMGG